MGCDIDTSMNCGCEYFGGHRASCPQSHYHGLYKAGFDRTSNIDGETFCRGCGCAVVRPNIHKEVCIPLKELLSNG